MHNLIYPHPYQKMKKSFSLPFFLLAGLLPLHSQAPAFSQFYANPNTLNPAYVSTVRGLDAAFGYRKQWGQVQGGFTTKSASLALRTCRAPVAFGFYANDISETFFGYRWQEAGLLLSTFWAAPKDKFSVHGGLQAGLGQHRVDYARLLFSGQLDPLFGVQGSPSPLFLTDGSSLQTFDVAAGLLARGNIEWSAGDMPASLGVAVHHLGGSRDVSFLGLDSRQARYWVLHGSVTTPIGSGRQEAPLYLNWLARLELESSLRRSATGLIAQYDVAHLGLIYQWNRNPVAAGNTHALTVVTGLHFKIGSKLACSLQYAFDGALSGLGQNASGGAHELILQFSFPEACVFGGKTKKGRTDCFHFIGKGYKPFLN